MLRVIHAGMNRPVSRPVDPNAVFQPGMIGQHKLIGNEIVMGVSDGIAPFGIIQDIRDIAYVRPVIDELVIVEPTSIDDSGPDPVVGADTISLLQNSSVLQQSFASDISGVNLVATNGAIIVKTGTPLNYKKNPLSTGNDSVVVRVRYSYYIPNKPGDDSTLGSNKVSIWASPSGCIFSTDQFETAAVYPLNAALYVSPAGKLTSEQLIEAQPAVAMVCVPPTSINPMLEFLWL